MLTSHCPVSQPPLPIRCRLDKYIAAWVRRLGCRSVGDDFTRPNGDPLAGYRGNSSLPRKIGDRQIARQNEHSNLLTLTSWKDP